MTLLAFGLAAILLILAALHAYWGFGGFWPGHDAKSCARTVIGSRGVTTMPAPSACFAVTAMLAVASLIALAQGGILALGLPTILWSLVTLGVMLVFLGRGVAGYVPAWRRLWPEQPFARLDVRLYSPLCLAIGIGFAVLLLKDF